MLSNAYFLAKIGADTAEDEQHFAEILAKTGIPLHIPRAVTGREHKPTVGFSTLWNFLEVRLEGQGWRTELSPAAA